MWQASVHLNVVKNRNIGEEQAARDLKAAGMSQQSINGLGALSRKFLVEFPKVEKDPAASEKFVADFTLEADQFIQSMSDSDKVIYKAHREKHGIDK